MACPSDSEEHRVFREEICELGLLGSEGACKYYLSIITGIDQFALWSDEFLNNLRDFVNSQAAGATAAFRIDADTEYVVVPLLKAEMRRVRPQLIGNKPTKEERAIEMLFHNPGWSDYDVAKSVPTTVRQLQRFSTYKLLRLNRNVRS
jgi:hypothetical protein